MTGKINLLLRLSDCNHFLHLIGEGENMSVTDEFKQLRIAAGERCDGAVKESLTTYISIPDPSHS